MNGDEKRIFEDKNEKKSRYTKLTEILLCIMYMICKFDVLFFVCVLVLRLFRFDLFFKLTWRFFHTKIYLCIQNRRCLILLRNLYCFSKEIGLYSPFSFPFSYTIFRVCHFLFFLPLWVNSFFFIFSPKYWVEKTIEIHKQRQRFIVGCRYIILW